MSRMKSSTPARKVTFASLGAAVSVILIWVVKEYVPGVPLTPKVEGAITVLVTFAIGYVVPPGSSDQTTDA